MARSPDPSSVSAIESPPAENETPAFEHPSSAAGGSAAVSVSPGVGADDPLGRLESALSRVAGTVASLEATATRAEDILERLDTRVREAESCDASVRRRVLGLEETCARADQVHGALTGFSNQLAEVCDQSGDQVSKLRQTLDSGSSERERLEGLMAQAINEADRLERLVEASSKSSGADSGSEGIGASDAALLRELVEQAIEGHRGSMEEAARGHLETLEEVVRSQEKVLTATGERCVAQIKRAVEARDADLRRRHESVRELARRSREDADRIEALVDGRERRLTEIAEECVAKVEGVFEERLSEVRRQIDERIVSEREAAKDAWAKTSKTARAARRAVEGLVEDCAERAQALVSRQEARLADAAQQHVRATKQAFAEQLDDVKRSFDAELASELEAANESVRRTKESTREACQALDRLIEGHNQRAEALVDCRESRLAEVADHCAANLQQVYEDKVAQIQQVIDGKMAAHAAGAEKVARAADVATEEAERCLGRLVEERERIEREVASLTSTAERMSAAVEEYQAAGREIQPSIDTLSGHLEGSRVAIDKIERLIQDVWTLTTTVQQRARQLTERCDAAASTAKTIEELQRTAEAHASTLSGHNLSARRRSERLGKMTRAGEALLSRLESAHESATRSVEEASRTAERAQVCDAALGEKLSSADVAAERLEHAVVESSEAFDRISDECTGAREILEAIAQDAESYRALAEELHGCDARGQKVAEKVEEAISAGVGIRDELAGLTERAMGSSRDLAQMLAAMTERRELLEGSDETVKAFLESAEQVRIKLQQLQTRGDAFQHQLNSMLADPRKIVEQAKTQAGELESVCSAVRKIFAGLSQASLQANRDITKFTKISREANGRLTQISAETERAGQSLREWVDEALHVQTRLSKSLANVPPLSQTHPVQNLDALLRTTSASVPELLQSPDRQRGAAGRRMPGRAGALAGRDRGQTSIDLGPPLDVSTGSDET